MELQYSRPMLSPTLRRGVAAVALSLLVAGAASACVAPGTAGGARYSVESTAYCLQGQMASGRWVYDGAVAMNYYPGTNVRVPFGTRFRVDNGPMAGRVVTVEDRIGYGTQFDFWMYSCNSAINYGRRYIQVTALN